MYGPGRTMEKDGTLKPGDTKTGKHKKKHFVVTKRRKTDACFKLTLIRKKLGNKAFLLKY